MELVEQSRDVIRTETLKNRILAHSDIVTDDENTKYLAEIGLVQVAQSVLWADGWRSVAEGYFMSLHACEDLGKLKIMHRNASKRVYVAVDVDGEVQECIAKQMTIQGIDNEDLIEEQDRDDLIADLESRAI